MNGPPSEPQKNVATRAFLKSFMATVICALMLIVAVVSWGNPWGNYGRTGFFSFYNDRLAKTEHLLEIAAEDGALPDTLIMGPSTLYPVLPASVEARFGGNAFNLATFWCRMPEIMAWLDFVLEDLQAQPKTILLGVHPWTFADPGTGPVLFPSLRRRVLNAPALMAHRPETTLRVWLSKVFDAVSWQQAALTLAALREGQERTQHETLSERKGYSIDGSGPYAERDPPDETRFMSRELNARYERSISGTASASDKAEIQRHLDGQVDLDASALNHAMGLPLDDDGIDELRRFLSTCEARDIELLLVLMPVHPAHEALVSRSVDLPTRQQWFRDLIAREITAHPALRSTLVDATSLASFGGDPNEFVDFQHMTPNNTDRILDLVQRTREGQR